MPRNRCEDTPLQNKKPWGSSLRCRKIQGVPCPTKMWLCVFEMMAYHLGLWSINNYSKTKDIQKSKKPVINGLALVISFNCYLLRNFVVWTKSSEIQNQLCIMLTQMLKWQTKKDQQCLWTQQLDSDTTSSKKLSSHQKHFLHAEQGEHYKLFIQFQVKRNKE